MKEVRFKVNEQFIDDIIKVKDHISQGLAIDHQQKNIVIELIDVLLDSLDTKKIEASDVFSVDKGKHEIRYHGKLINFTVAEYDVLNLLILRNGDIVSREDIKKKVKSIDYNSSKKSLDVLIGRIRTKLNDKKIIKSIRGVGYKLSILQTTSNNDLLEDLIKLV